MLHMTTITQLRDEKIRLIGERDLLSKRIKALDLIIGEYRKTKPDANEQIIHFVKPRAKGVAQKVLDVMTTIGKDKPLKCSDVYACIMSAYPSCTASKSSICSCLADLSRFGKIKRAGVGLYQFSDHDLIDVSNGLST